MKKTIFILLLVVAGFTKLNAQGFFNIGPKAGFSANRFQDVKKDDRIQFSNFHTVTAGAFARLSVGKVYLQPELIFLVRGSDYNLADSVWEGGKIRMSSLDVPVLVGYYFIRTPAFSLRGFAGPTLNVYSKEVKNDLKDLNPRDYTFDEGTNGIQLGFGVDVLMLTLDARYELGLNKINDTLDTRTRQLTFSVGYKFL